MKTSINLLNELLKENKKHFYQQNLLLQTKTILVEAKQTDDDVYSRLKQSSKVTGAVFTSVPLDLTKIISIEAIKKICVTYRLRFLSSTYFKGQIPYEAIVKINEIEKKSGFKFTEFMILAPSKMFNLCDSFQDPILVAKISPTKYYFIHKWGTDIFWGKKILFFAVQNVKNLAITSFLLGLLLSFFCPNEAFSEAFQKSLATLYLGKTFVGFIFGLFVFVSALIIGILKQKDFSENVWNDTYFN